VREGRQEEGRGNNVPYPDSMDLWARFQIRNN